MSGPVRTNETAWDPDGDGQTRLRIWTAKVDVLGPSFSTWQKFQPQLVEAVQIALASCFDINVRDTLWSEAKELIRSATSHHRQLLLKAGLENVEVEAEVIKLYAECEHRLAEAYSMRSMADALQFETAVKRLRLSLGLTKAMLVMEEGDQATLFGRQVDVMLNELANLRMTTNTGPKIGQADVIVEKWSLAERADSQSEPDEATDYRSAPTGGIASSTYLWERFDLFGSAGLFSYTAGIIGAAVFMALALGPGWLGFLAAYLPASILASWAVTSHV